MAIQRHAIVHLFDKYREWLDNNEQPNSRGNGTGPQAGAPANSTGNVVQAEEPRQNTAHVKEEAPPAEIEDQVQIKQEPGTAAATGRDEPPSSSRGGTSAGGAVAEDSGEGDSSAQGDSGSGDDEVSGRGQDDGDTDNTSAPENSSERRQGASADEAPGCPQRIQGHEGADLPRGRRDSGVGFSEPRTPTSAKRPRSVDEPESGRRGEEDGDDSDAESATCGTASPSKRRSLRNLERDASPSPLGRKGKVT